MNRAVVFLTSVAMALALGTSAWAADDDSNAVERAGEATGHAIKSGAETTGHAIKSGAEATGHAIKKGAQATTNALGITDTDRQFYETHERGEHKVSGKVAAVDHKTGMVTLARDNRTTYQFYFPAKSLQGVSKGDHLVVATGFALPAEMEQEHAAADGQAVTRHRAADEPMHGEHWATGTITAVDASNGVVTVDSSDGPLTVPFAPAAMRDLKQGDKIAVELAFTKAPRSAR